MMRRRELMMLGGGLPGAYRRVEYLQGNGQQYFIANTGIYEDTVCHCKFAPTASMSEQSQYAAAYGISVGPSSNPSFSIFIAVDYIAARLGYWSAANTGTIYSETQNATDVLADTTCQINSLTVNGHTYTGSQVWRDTLQAGKFGVFCRCTDAGQYRAGSAGRLRIYSLSLRSSTPAGNANFIPCVRKSDNKPGMYDTVSKTFYTNSGTGEFVVPD